MIAFIHRPPIVIFSLFGIDIMWYGVLIAVGIFLGVFVGGKMAERFGVSEDDFSSMMIWAIVAAIIRRGSIMYCSAWIIILHILHRLSIYAKAAWLFTAVYWQLYWLRICMPEKRSCPFEPCRRGDAGALL